MEATATTREPKEGKKRGLSRLEIFGLTSGSIGLIADAISLSALFKMTSAGLAVPKSGWITMLILITYTGVILGFYSRRILCYLNRGKEKNEKFTKQGYARIEHASVVITSLIIGTLCLMVIYSVFQQALPEADQIRSRNIREINEKYEKLKAKATPEEIEKLEGSKETDLRGVLSAEAELFPIWSLGGGLSVLLITGINLLARSIYRGCDLNYQAGATSIF